MMYLVSTQNRIKNLVNQANLPQETLPEEYQNCMTEINQLLKICWEIVNKSRNVCNENGKGQTITMIDNKTILQALALINDCNKYKMDLTTNGVVITDAINLVQTKEKLTMSTKKEDNGSKENEEQLEKSQEEKTREIEQETTNHIF